MNRSLSIKLSYTHDAGSKTSALNETDLAEQQRLWLDGSLSGGDQHELLWRAGIQASFITMQ